MTIIDKSKPKSAKAIFQPKPNFKVMLKKDIDAYWDKELEKYILGTDANGEKVMSQSDDWQSGLTGYQYFFLNSGLKVTTTKGKLITPSWRKDDEDLLFHPLEMCDRLINKGTGDYDDFVIIKRRRYGLSTHFMGAYPIYNLIVNPGSVYAVTSADWRRIAEGFNSKLRPIWKNLNTGLNPKEKSWVVSKSESHLHVTYKEKDDEGEDRMGYIEGVETAKNPKNIEGYTLNKAFLDEIGLHPAPARVKASANAALSDDLFRTGYMILGGTVGEMSMEGSKELQNLIEPHYEMIDGKEQLVSAPHIVYSLVMGYHAVKQFTTNGWTDHKAATEWIEKERELKSKLADKTDYEKFLKDYPLTREEMFDVSGKCSLPVQLRDPWRKQMSIVNSKDEQGSYGYFERDENGQHRFIKHRDGNIFFLREPIREHTHIFGTDPQPYNEADDDEGSENVIIAHDLTTGEDIGFYAERHKDPTLVAQNCVIFQDYCGGGLNMIEKNVAGVLIQEYRRMGRTDLLAKKPMKIGENQKWGEAKDKYGFQKGQNAAYLYSLIISHWNKNIYNIKIKRYLQEMQFFMRKNHDLLDAAIALELLKEVLRKKQEVDDYEQPTKVKIRTLKNGKYVFIDVPMKGLYKSPFLR